jgi:hypothetical protein
LTKAICRSLFRVFFCFRFRSFRRGKTESAAVRDAERGMEREIDGDEIGNDARGARKVIEIAITLEFLENGENETSPSQPITQATQQ